ncbi:hypothetical protein [Winogradskyella helgolandensis]|uniref:hypothetical protein n=1 Tax=Winogradskyella helgolandensis TaxID=2697010 RepID=UPI0015CA84B6|nr:hypothetical protein [Winogradskyella helgolandensis]
MIFLDPYNPKIVSAKNSHADKILPIVLERVDDLPNGELKDFLNEFRIRRILTDLPDRLDGHHQDWLRTISTLNIAEWEDYLRIKKKWARNRLNPEKRLLAKYITVVNEINSIFKYTGAFANKKTLYSTYDLAENLNVNTCVYCNRVYTKTVIKPKKVTRPEFDHWFPKETYPLLALSFYNLIPSCHICNSSTKTTTIMNTRDYLHPYLPENTDISFSYWIESINKYCFHIKRPFPSKEHNTIIAFKLEEIYETHTDEIHDLVRLRKLYSVDYLLKLKGLLSTVDNNVSMEELYRLAFGTHVEEKNFIKRPLSKMKRDILKELGIIS